MKSSRTFNLEKLTYIALGILIGSIVGVVISVFRIIVDFFLNHLGSWYHVIKSDPPLLIGWFLFMTTLGLIVSKLSKDEPDIKGSGIQNIGGQLYDLFEINWFSVMWRKFLGSLIALGAGLALSRRGPAIQVGGAIGQGINAFIKGDLTQKKILISACVSAGLSAAFNAPISGIVFILEEIHHKFSSILLLSAFSASIMANFVVLKIVGLKPPLQIETLLQFPIEHYLHLVIMGIMLAVTGRIYQASLLFTPKLYQKLPISSHYHGVIPFLLVIPIGLFLPDLLGGGTSVITMITSTRFSTIALLGIFLVRFLFSQLSYGSGLPGGIFIPVLSIGALIGGIYGNGVLHLTGIEDAFIRSFILYAMGGFLTAVTKSPLTSIILMIEMTGNLSQLMPLAIVVLSAYIVADLMGSESIYDELLNQKRASLSAYPDRPDSSKN